MAKPRTLGELRDSGYRPLTVKQELRKNLIAKLRANDNPFPGIVGYDETVLPHLESAILSGHDVIMLGERGQAKTRIARTLVGLLDDEIPVVAGSDLNDDPLRPISRYAVERIEVEGDDTEISWLPRDLRYGEKLATPDTTIADLIGEVDPIKVAEGRYLSNELTIHFGLIPRTNRGIFCINELPDLAERIQVGLLNILEERDVQIRGFKIRLDLDLFMIASANPEDYTNRGRIITPLKDRFGSQIRTHYPKNLGDEIDIMDAERLTFEDDGFDTTVPRFLKEIIAEVTHLARKNNDISQRSGVSVRVSVANYENVVANAFKRAIRLGERHIVPRISDLSSLVSSTAGKIELETVGEAREERVIEKLVTHATLNTFNRSFSVQEFDDVIAGFERGKHFETSETLPSMEYVRQATEFPSLRLAVQKLKAQGNPALVASAIEFILEGLHLNRRLNKDKSAGQARYRR